MLTLNKDSLLYRYWATSPFVAPWDDTVSLCKFVRQLGYTTLFYLVVAVILLWFVASPVAYFAFGTDVLFRLWLALVIAVAAAVVSGGVIWFFAEKLPSMRYRRTAKQSILGAWISAKKQKICPFITFE